jgi:hypothetical protein
MDPPEQPRTEEEPLTWAILTFVGVHTVKESTIKALPNRLPEKERDLFVVGLAGTVFEGQNPQNRMEVRWEIRIDVDHQFHVNTKKIWKRANEIDWQGENWRVVKIVADPENYYRNIRQRFYNRTGYFDETRERQGNRFETSAEILRGMFVGGTYLDGL